MLLYWLSKKRLKSNPWDASIMFCKVTSSASCIQLNHNAAMIKDTDHTMAAFHLYAVPSYQSHGMTRCSKTSQPPAFIFCVNYQPVQLPIDHCPPLPQSKSHEVHVTSPVGPLHKAP